MLTTPRTKRLPLAFLIFFALALSGCVGSDATDAPGKAAAATHQIDETRPSDVPAPAPIPPAITRGEFKIITISGGIMAIAVSTGLDTIRIGNSDTHHFDVPTGAVSMKVDLAWTTSSYFVGAYQDVPASDLELHVVGPGAEGREGLSDCTNYAPLPDPKGGSCNRDRSEQVILEGLGAADVGQWHLRVYVSYDAFGSPSAKMAPDAYYTATIAFR